MKLKRLTFALLACILAIPMARADKGMWLINELKKENIERMKAMGLNIDPTKLFDLDDPGIANAVVIFGGGCTGITVSDEGLIFTNHHCGYEAIQSQSTVEHDYLQDGFISHQKSEELPIPGLQVQYLREFVDVTDQVLAAAEGLTNTMERIQAQMAAIEEIEKPYQDRKHLSAQVYPFYNNNKFYLVIYDVFSDVRLAFAPPSSVGKFGHDSDNWMWPRHTNDFSVFRVYADKDNQPADYAPDNKPYTPRHFAKISLKGVKEKDFSMTIGFPGSTSRYLSSWGVIDRIQNTNEPTILVRGAKQDVWKAHMANDQATRIQYASKYARSSNYWKNFIGMNRGLKRLNVVGNKQKIEKEFAAWVNANPARQAEYGFVLDSLRIPLEQMAGAKRNITILSEALSGMELRPLIAMPPRDIKAFDAGKLYKDFSPAVGRATLPVMLRVARQNVTPDALPSIYNKIDSDFGGDYEKYADYLYDNSVFVTQDRLLKALENYDALEAAYPTDPAVILVQSFGTAIREQAAEVQANMLPYMKGDRAFFRGLQEMWPDRALPSDANFTMRLSYGQVGGYSPYDAAWYDYYTTQRGVFEKQDPDVYEYAVQPEILQLLSDKESYSHYADPEDGNLHVNFISNNDITGGNSGSPVFNGDGDLIGLAFDGNWEAMSGDIEFEPDLQRCICVDIRYVLYFIDVWGKASNLMNELTIAD